MGREGPALLKPASTSTMFTGNAYLNDMHTIYLALFLVSVAEIHCLSPFAPFLADNSPWPQRCPSENSSVKEGKIKPS